MAKSEQANIENDIEVYSYNKIKDSIQINNLYLYLS